MSGAQQSRQTTLVSIHAPSNRFRRCHLSLQSPASPFPHGTCLLLVSTTDTALHIDFKTMYGERPNPDFSRLRAIMSFAEHDKLMAWFGKMHAAGCTGCVPMFDGVLFNTDTLRMEMKVARTIESVCGETGFVFEVKQWPAGASKNRLPSGVLQDCPLQVFDAEVHPVGHLHCVLSGVSFIIGGFTMCVGEDGERPSLTVQDLNTFELHSPQRDPVRISQLQHMDRLRTVVPVVVCATSGMNPRRTTRKGAPRPASSWLFACVSAGQWCSLPILLIACCCRRPPKNVSKRAPHMGASRSSG